MTEKLKPCPFCGSDDVVVETCGSPADNNLCFCPRCGAEVVG